MQPFDGRAKWIWSEEGIERRPERQDDPYRVRFFRRSFEAQAGATLTVHVSADSRYVLFLNGELIARGPARGDVSHQFYDTHELSSKLRAGGNVLSALAIYCGDVMPTFFTTGAPCNLMTAAPGFILDGVLRPPSSSGDSIEDLSTNAKWKVFTDTGACRHAHCENAGTYTGFTERFDARQYPWGWQSAEYSDAKWPAAREIFHGVRPDTVRDSFMPQRMVPRLIPLMEQRPIRFERVFRGPPEWSAFIAGKGPLSVPAYAKVDVTLAVDGYTTACPKLRCSGGKGAVIRLTYDEALRVDGVKQRGAKTDGEVAGVYDEITCDGGAGRSWEAWHYRAFRFARVQITTGPEALTLEDLGLTFWAYPYALRARFDSDDEFHAKLFSVAFHTMRMCSHEVVEDCPYYEQLCYVGDFTVQNQIAAYTTGDYSLARQGLLMFNWSRHPEEGLTASRYPCRMPQIIPGFSQFYIMGVNDLYRVSGDAADVRPHLEGISSVLNWFERRREHWLARDQSSTDSRTSQRHQESKRGVVGKLQYWCVMDWSADWDPNGPAFGCPPGSYDEASALYSFFHVWCLKMAAALYDACGVRAPAPYAAMAEELAQTAHDVFWNEAAGAYRDCLSKPICSQMTNAFAILSGTAQEETWTKLAEKLVDPKLARAAYFGEHFVFRALGQAGRFDLFYPRLATYRDLIETQCFATLPEDPVNQRSDCHGWSGGPAYHLLANGLGVQPLEPGFGKILIAPQPGPLKTMKGEVPTPRGPVSVDLALKNSRWTLKAQTPKGVSVVVRLPGQEERVCAGGEIAI